MSYYVSDTMSISLTLQFPFGTDAVAAVRMSGMCARGGSELLADIGTNGEIALWSDNRLPIASVAAGPAFERPGVTGSEIIAVIADGLEDGALFSGW